MYELYVEEKMGGMCCERRRYNRGRLGRKLEKFNEGGYTNLVLNSE